MRGRYSTSFDAGNDFVLNSLILAELRKELESKMRLETASTHKKPLLEKYKDKCASMQTANTITFKKSKNICQSLPWNSKKYGNRSGGARKYCQWATFLKRKR